MSWEDAVIKYRQRNSPPMQDIMPSQPHMATVVNPAAPNNNNSNSNSNNNNNNNNNNQLRALLTHDSDVMDLDQSVGGVVGAPPGRPPFSDARMSRTPLPAGPCPAMVSPRQETMFSGQRPFPDNKQMPLPAIGTLGGPNASLQAALERIVASRSPSRYSAVQVLLLSWQDDQEAVPAVDELAHVFTEHYRFDCEVHRIPHESPWKWLSKVILGSSDDSDRRDMLKIVYYNGHSHLDASREMVLAR